MEEYLKELYNKHVVPELEEEFSSFHYAFGTMVEKFEEKYYQHDTQILLDKYIRKAIIYRHNSVIKSLRDDLESIGLNTFQENDPYEDISIYCFHVGRIPSFPMNKLLVVEDLKRHDLFTSEFHVSATNLRSALNLIKTNLSTIAVTSKVYQLTDVNNTMVAIKSLLNKLTTSTVIGRNNSSLNHKETGEFLTESLNLADRIYNNYRGHVPLDSHPIGIPPVVLKAYKEEVTKLVTRLDKSSIDDLIGINLDIGIRLVRFADDVTHNLAKNTSKLSGIFPHTVKLIKNRLSSDEESLKVMYSGITNLVSIGMSSEDKDIIFNEVLPINGRLASMINGNIIFPESVTTESVESALLEIVNSAIVYRSEISSEVRTKIMNLFS